MTSLNVYRGSLTRPSSSTYCRPRIDQPTCPTGPSAVAVPGGPHRETPVSGPPMPEPRALPRARTPRLAELNPRRPAPRQLAEAGPDRQGQSPRHVRTMRTTSTGRRVRPHRTRRRPPAHEPPMVVPSMSPCQNPRRSPSRPILNRGVGGSTNPHSPTDGCSMSAGTTSSRPSALAATTRTCSCSRLSVAGVVRTVCGLDAVPHSHQAVDSTGNRVGDVVTVWPAPQADRCPDCAAITGVGRRKAAGSHSFTEAHPIGAPARSSAA